METATNIHRRLYDLFETRTRNASYGTTFQTLKDDVPDWAHEFIREAHGTEMLPDDWRYACVVEALETLANNPDSDPDELAHEFADGVDIYMSDLLAWVGSHLSRPGYVDDAQAEGLVSEDATLAERLMTGQCLERLEVFRQTVEATQNVADLLGDEMDGRRER